jgi:hypothetical protein
MVRSTILFKMLNVSEKRANERRHCGCPLGHGQAEAARMRQGRTMEDHMESPLS